MDKLLVNSRASRLQSLQALTEIQEYIKFRSEPGTWWFRVCVVGSTYFDQ